MIFNLKRKWWDLIAAGKKNIEYREIKPYWTNRLSKLAIGDEIIFRLGYSKGKDIRAVFNFYDTGKCPYEGWTDDYYRIHFTAKETKR